MKEILAVGQPATPRRRRPPAQDLWRKLRKIEGPRRAWWAYRDLCGSFLRWNRRGSYRGTNAAELFVVSAAKNRLGFAAFYPFANGRGNLLYRRICSRLAGNFNSLALKQWFILSRDEWGNSALRARECVVVIENSSIKRKVVLPGNFSENMR